VKSQQVKSQELSQEPQEVQQGVWALSNDNPETITVSKSNDRNILLLFFIVFHLHS
jgi:hypothetical protein